MKNEKICISKTLAVIIPVALFLVGVVLLANTMNGQNMSTNSRAALPRDTRVSIPTPTPIFGISSTLGVCKYNGEYVRSPMDFKRAERSGVTSGWYYDPKTFCVIGQATDKMNGYKCLTQQFTLLGVAFPIQIVANGAAKPDTSCGATALAKASTVPGAVAKARLSFCGTDLSDVEKAKWVGETGPKQCAHLAQANGISDGGGLCTNIGEHGTKGSADELLVCVASPSSADCSWGCYTTQPSEIMEEAAASGELTSKLAAAVSAPSTTTESTATWSVKKFQSVDNSIDGRPVDWSGLEASCEGKDFGRCVCAGLKQGGICEGIGYQAVNDGTRVCIAPPNMLDYGCYLTVSQSFFDQARKGPAPASKKEGNRCGGQYPPPDCACDGRDADPGCYYPPRPCDGRREPGCIPVPPPRR